MAHIRSRQSAFFYQCRTTPIIIQQQKHITQSIRHRPSLAPNVHVDQAKLVAVSVPIRLALPALRNTPKYHIMRYESALVNGPDTVPEGGTGNVSSDNTGLQSCTGDYSRLGTQSSEYFLVDTDPASETPPYDSPRHSGRQLRYGGRQFASKDNLEAFGEMSKANEGPSGTACYGML